VHLDQIAFPHAETGSPTPAAYQWMVDARTKEISFARLFDDCAPRIDWVTSEADEEVLGNKPYRAVRARAGVAAPKFMRCRID
jgi:hypothetical protein